MVDGVKQVVLVGECLIELNGEPFGALRQSYGGDTFNTALYLARLTQRHAAVHYATALGADPLSDELLRRWRDEGIHVDLVLRDLTRRPGLYWVSRDARGERSFTYWRAESAARHLLQHAQLDRVASALAKADLIYLSGISLAILPVADRAKLLGLLTQLAGQGATILYDPNYRPALWPAQDARESNSAVASIASLVLATFDDERLLWGDSSPAVTEARLLDTGARQVVVKLGAEGCRYATAAERLQIPAHAVAHVVDTTAAGDAFNAAFLAASLSGHSPATCCETGNRLAARVIQHLGALLPREATPTLPELLAADYRA